MGCKAFSCNDSLQDDKMFESVVGIGPQLSKITEELESSGEKLPSSDVKAGSHRNRANLSTNLVITKCKYFQEVRDPSGSKILD